MRAPQHGGSDDHHGIDLAPMLDFVLNLLIFFIIITSFVKQAGVNTDGNANGNGTSADGGSAGGDQRSAQGGGERNGSNDASLSRRGAGRDRSF